MRVSKVRAEGIIIISSTICVESNKASTGNQRLGLDILALCGTPLSSLCDIFCLITSDDVYAVSSVRHVSVH